ncbi:MAG: 2-amino-4-hydroxy-6-hydroxymethyldihydropteridine diphosphokinase [Nitrospirota bacterium]|nr:2-amino-4-hydroxy-6-hydroxymethyldihydropteridine diphosphokinase [Nitrospirota bacterium]
MPLIHIGIGSNLGNRQENCLEAIRRLEQQGLSVLKRSSLIESEPWGVTDQPHFINMAIEAETDLSPQNLLQCMKDIECSMGRVNSVHWGPRVIDLDILFYDDRTIDSVDLKIPHPHLHERVFVLMSLLEIAPEKVHPVLKKRVSELKPNTEKRSSK